MPTLDLDPAMLVEIRRILRRHAPGVEVWAYGSRVTGGAHSGSDLDLVLRDPGDLTRRQSSLAVLRRAFRESDIPILVDVRDWAQIPESFREEIERAHVPIADGESVSG